MMKYGFSPMAFLGIVFLLNTSVKAMEHDELRCERYSEIECRLKNAMNDFDFTELSKVLQLQVDVNKEFQYFKKQASLDFACEVYTLAPDDRKGNILGCISLLCAYGAKLDVGDSESGDTPLHKACKDGCQELITILLAFGADIYKKNNDRLTPLELLRQVVQIVENNSRHNYYSCIHILEAKVRELANKGGKGK